VEELCHFLAACGAELEGVGTKSITVHGQRELAAPAQYPVIADRIEAGTYLLALAGTGGSGRVAGARAEHLEACLAKLREAGAEVEADGEGIALAAPERLRAVSLRTDYHPGFPTDLQPQFTTVLACADGVSTIHETVFERRMGHVAELHRMGAQLALSGDTLIVTGVDQLAGVPVEAADLRGAAALVVAGLMAQGETRIAGLHYLLRGYELLPEKLAALGGSVEYISDEDDPPAALARLA
jgi:UDP-N-acetylglucosamine 1-carboxyvinyltransferase